jgi:hypothetical protein
MKSYIDVLGDDINDIALSKRLCALLDALYSTRKDPWMATLKRLLLATT